MCGQVSWTGCQRGEFRENGDQIYAEMWWRCDEDGRTHLFLPHFCVFWNPLTWKTFAPPVLFASHRECGGNATECWTKEHEMPEISLKISKDQSESGQCSNGRWRTMRFEDQGCLWIIDKFDDWWRDIVVTSLIHELTGNWWFMERGQWSNIKIVYKRDVLLMIKLMIMIDYGKQ